MKLLKLAVYGAIGYLVYQTFFADSQARGSMRGSHGHNGRRQNLSESGQGREEQTEDSSGTSMKHRVGRGVI